MAINDPPPYTPPRTVPAATQGWQCPACYATYAPWVASCTECAPAKGLRTRIAEAQPPPPRLSGPLPHNMLAATTVTNATMTIDQARLTMCSGAAQPSWTSTVWFGGKTFELGPDRDDDDGAAGVPARI